MLLRRRRPLWNAFSLTAAAILLVVTGLVGYTLSKHDRFVAGTPWTDGVIWWQVAVGGALLAAAVWFWRKGLREIRAERRL